ncbi:hypothetical protein CASFOL_035022 [Castilleja foliolosa]|uniref:Uncharacterized protein n=1 Tax=Castilleja foliolosa TaxID=1961234 RepID=A0ABD3BTV0_9LAMI
MPRARGAYAGLIYSGQHSQWPRHGHYQASRRVETRELAAKTGKEPTNYEILLNYHQKPDGTFTDSKSKRISDEYQITLSQRLADSDEGTLIDPNEVYLDIVGTTKGRRFGLGCLGKKVGSGFGSSQESVRYKELQDKLAQQQDKLTQQQEQIERMQRTQEAQSQRELMFGETLQQTVAAAGPHKSLVHPTTIRIRHNYYGKEGVYFRKIGQHNEVIKSYITLIGSGFYPFKNVISR